MISFGEFMTRKSVFSEAMAPEQKAIKNQVLAKFAHMTPEEMLPLPERHDLYFKLNEPGTIMVPMTSLANLRAREEGIKNALTMMYAASIGENMGLGKRVPISVREVGPGKYEIIDGNSTYNVAKASGWREIPAILTGS
jgi:hypothetical protein